MRFALSGWSSWSGFDEVVVLEAPETVEAAVDCLLLFRSPFRPDLDPPGLMIGIPSGSICSGTAVCRIGDVICCCCT
jgi:hypothetical protein